MGNSDDDAKKLVEELIRDLAAKDPEMVMKLARDRMKEILGTDLELHDAGAAFETKWTSGGVSVWAPTSRIIDLLREAHSGGCDGIYIISLFDERPGDKN